MKKVSLFLLLSVALCSTLLGQETPEATRQRLDFARTYFEAGAAYTPSFKGPMIQDGSITQATHAGKLHPYLTWGGFHFWGHAEFYVVFPLANLNIQSGPEHDYLLKHSVVTGARYLPWAYQPGKLRPYVGLSWSALDFRPRHASPEEAPVLINNFVPAPDAGLLFGQSKWVGRLAVNYLPKNTWEYAVSPTQMETFRTPSWSLQAGIIYTFENGKDKDEAVNERWNSYPRRSKLATEDSPKGDWFVGIGPSTSFGLQPSAYSQAAYPFLNAQLNSGNYWDIAVGYQWNQAGWFTALSYRNPTFSTHGYGVQQQVQKTSLALELSKILVDWGGFAPFVGLNLAWDQLDYLETTEAGTLETQDRSLQPGLTFGWDIVPGKTDEFFILRTNLRWYPFSRFEVEGESFQFAQLEYNLIQAVFYPERFLKQRKNRR
ncbi:MAG TPA: hypothetical protein DCE41_06685 [Cytophagales bacterium]|nr:hypothetical protein [Cytophagales bacterium]